MKVGIIKPPNKKSMSRGVGFYTERLLTAFNKRRDIETELIDFSFSPLSYRSYDLLHFPYFDLFFLTFPPIRHKKTVVTLHDVTQLKFPEGFPLGIRGKNIWPIQKKLLESTDAVLTDSEASKKDIIEFAGYPKEKITVTLLAGDKAFIPIKDTLYLSKISKKYELPPRFALYVGGVNWNKNLPVLAKACLAANISLVTVGTAFVSEQEDINHFEKKRFKEFLEITRGNSLFRFLGFVPTDDLAGIYNLANVYVQPSVYEGFGLPVLEAMGCGCPVICGDNSSLPEIAGEAGEYVDVSDHIAMAAAIEKIISLSSGQRAKITKKSIIQAAKFNWDQTAQKTYEVYKKVLVGV